jgi:iron complex outermembrane receptor protein
VGGANYFHDSFDFLSYYGVGLTALIPVLDPTTGTFLTPTGAVSLNTDALHDYQFQGTTQRRREEALFWDGNYDITDKFQFTAGVRYSKDHKDFTRFVDGGGPCTPLTNPNDIKTTPDGVCHDTHSNFISRAGITPSSFNEGVFSPLPLSAFGTKVNSAGDWHKTTYRTVLDYKPLPGQLVYLSYATGFVSGGFSETCATVARCKYDPESNSNLEFGYKSDLLDNTLRFNIAAYLTKYTALQQAVVAAYQAADGSGQQETVTINTGSSKAEGVDLETTWVPTKSVRVEASINYLHHRYTGGEIPDLVHTPPGPSTPLSQYAVTFSPQWKGNLGLYYDLPLASSARWTLHADGNYQGTAQTDVYNTANTQMQSRLLLDLSATFHDRSGKWSFTPWVANVTDKVYRIAALPVAGLWNFTNYGPPRSFGITGNFRFE